MGDVNYQRQALIKEENKVQAEGKALRKSDIQTHIDKIEARKKELTDKGLELMKSGKQDSEEYQALIDQHRMLRGKQRFFEDAQKDVQKDSTEDDETSRSVYGARAGEAALDRLRKESGNQ